MRIPFGWLGEFVEDLPDAKTCADLLTMGGLEIEALDEPWLTTPELLVVARVLETEKHPDADRLSVCRVDDGDEVRTIVCGAPNVTAEMFVVLAKPGARLPGGMKIKRSKIRGVESLGMLCGASELGLPEAEDGIISLTGELTVGESAAALLGLDQTVMELGITPNRGDCLSIRGVARDLAALVPARLAPEFSAQREAPEGSSRVDVEIQDDGGLLYRGLEVRGVTVGPSPTWLRGRLAALGLRSINNVVDITNFVLMELGQPLHAFDCDVLAGPSLRVTKAGTTKSMTTLDGQEVALEESDLLICDADGPVALAGVMGGAGSAVSDQTRNIFLEAAAFVPTRVRRTARRLGLSTDSSYRFERGIDLGNVEQALLRAAELLVEIGGGEIAGGIVRVGQVVQAAEPIVLRSERCSSVLGMDVSNDVVESVLDRLGLDAQSSGGEFQVRVPLHRHDLTREIDLIEEVARVVGYSNVPAVLPHAGLAAASVPPGYREAAVLRSTLAAAGLTETVGLVFCTPESNALLPGLFEGEGSPVELLNPLRADRGELRRSLLATLFEHVAANLRNGASSVDVFTLGKTFLAGDPPKELDLFGGVLVGPRRGRGPGKGEDAALWDGLGVVEAAASALGVPRSALAWKAEPSRREYHPRACARAEVGGKPVGFVGLIHPTVAEHLEIPEELCVFEIDTRKLVDYAPARPPLKSIPKFPPSSRDVSFLLERDTLAGEVIDAVKGLGETLLEEVRVFDEYFGQGVPSGRKALGFTMIYRAAERTLTDDEVSELHDRVVQSVVEQFTAEVRA